MMRLASFRNHQMVLLMMYTDCHQTKETKALYLFTIATHDQCDHGWKLFWKGDELQLLFERSLTWYI